MFNIKLSVFDDPDDNPDWMIDDEEAIAILEISECLVYSLTTYDVVDQFEDELPVGYEGFGVTDEETGTYWRVKDSTVFKYDTKGVQRAEDTGANLESLLRELVKKRDYMWFALSESTKYVAPPSD